MSNEHEHILPNGETIVHTHADNGHSHAHTHTKTKAVLNRLSRLTGHMHAIKKMVEEGRDCSEVLIQLSAVRAALNGVGKIILKDHLEHCLADAMRQNDKETLDKFNKAIDQFIK